ncbi:glutathione S-transferase [Thalassotalea euphylliae]|uniref:Glutathione S-transferase n=1 Tax=Thalassotalea euphylliae TaxID=1655234 RepID=A0A3E0TQT6_9GAMM|nr:glutathione S-transferase [Thalassotalea euphylliae]REL26976.1 glutathione S-transferase [Thalassotalea euphylliae]
MSNALKIYSFPLSGHSHRVILFASLAGIAYEIINLDLANGEHKKQPYLSINPAGQVPAIVDGTTAIADSNAILVYLARKYAPTFLPEDPVNEAEVQKYLSLAAGEIAFGPAAARLINVFNADLDREFTHTIAAQALTKLETSLTGKDFLVGNKPSIADVAIYSYVAHAPEGDISLEPYPNVRRLLKNIEALHGFIPFKATKVGLAA